MLRQQSESQPATFAVLQRDGQDEGKEKLVFLEERAAHVVVDAHSEVLVQVLDTLVQVVRLLAVFYWLKNCARSMKKFLTRTADQKLSPTEIIEFNKITEKS